MEGRVIGLDVGEARTGIAISDELGIVAVPLETLQVRSHEEDAQAISGIVKLQDAVLIVAGVPLNREGGIGPQAEKVLAFLDVLKAAVEIDVVTIDERFSTAAANRALQQTGVKGKKRKKVVDQIAAQQILQLYLDKEAFRKRREG